MKLIKILFSVFLFFIQFGCQRIENEKNLVLYNEAAQSTLHKEILLNIVRLRYSEPPLFLSDNIVLDHRNGLNKLSHFVKSISTGKTKVPSGIEIYYGVSPFDFSKQLMSSIEPEVIEKILNHGWDIGSVLRILVKRLGEYSNAESRSEIIPQFAPIFGDFLTLANLLQKAYTLRKVDIKAIQRKREINEGEKLIENPLDVEKILNFSFSPNSEESDALADFLKITKKKRGVYEKDFIYDLKSGIYTRSFIECLQYLSLGVQVPPKDLNSGALIVTIDEEGSPFDWKQVIGDLISIRWSKSYPLNAFVAVHHNGYWFYIEETDFESKKTFSLIQYIFLMLLQK